MSTSARPPAVLVIGAGGNFGPYIVHELLRQKARFRRIAILSTLQKKEKFSSAAAKGIDVVVGDYKDAKSYKDFDIVISLAGNEIMIDQPQMIDASIEAGVTHFYPSEFGVDIGQEAFLEERYFRDKHLTRRYLRDKADKVPGFVFTEIIIGVFAETFVLSDAFGLDRKNKDFVYYGDMDDTKSISSMADSARFTIDSIFLPFEPGVTERTLRVPNGNYTVREMINLLNEIDKCEYEVKVLPSDEARASQEVARQAGQTDLELGYSLKALFSNPHSVVPGPWQNDLFGFKPKDLVGMFHSCT